jgi:Transposase, Mutator family
VARTEHALAELLAQDLTGLDLVALLVDGIRVADHTCVVGLGITIDGTKSPLALAEGATENATVVTDLLVGLRERGLEVTRPLLVVIDGAKALRRAVTEVTDRLPDALARWWPNGCGPPTTPATRWSPRPSWRPWPVSWTTRTQAPLPACGRDWPRP